jgi:hypothetical protein
MNETVSARELAVIIDLTERRVNQISKEKDIFPKDASGKFLVVQSVYNFYKDKFGHEDVSVALEREKVEHEKIKRQKSELILAKMRNELHDAATIEKVMTDMLVTFRNRMLSIPSKLAPQIIGQRNIGKISELIAKEVNDALTELSDYDPSMFAEGEVYEDEPENDQSVQEDP